MGRKKGQSKEKVGFSIDIETNTLLERYCQKNMINKSKLIDSLIKNFLIEKEVEIYGKTNYMDQ